MELYEAVKSYVDITWELTEAETLKLSGLISRGIAYIDRAAGTAQDYTKEDQARALLMDYVRYVRSNAFDEFQNNYLPELLSLQMYAEVPDDTEQD